MLDEFNLSCISKAFIQTAFGPRKLYRFILLCLVLTRKQFKCGIFFSICCLTMVLECSLSRVGLKFFVFLLGLFISHGLLVNSWAQFAKVLFFPCLMKERTMCIFFFDVSIVLDKDANKSACVCNAQSQCWLVGSGPSNIDLWSGLHSRTRIFHCFSICFQFSSWI